MRRPRHFRKITTVLRRDGADTVRPGWLWGLPLEDRVLLVMAYWRTDLTLRQLASLFGVSKSSADGIASRATGPGEASASTPPRRHSCRQRRTERGVTRSSRAISAVASPLLNCSATSNRSCSRRYCSAGVYPPAAAYLITQQ